MIIPWCNSPLKVRAYQLTASLTSTYPQTVVKTYPASLEVTLIQLVESPSRCWLLTEITAKD